MEKKTTTTTTSTMIIHSERRCSIPMCKPIICLALVLCLMLSLASLGTHCSFSFSTASTNNINDQYNDNNDDAELRQQQQLSSSSKIDSIVIMEDEDNRATNELVIIKGESKSELEPKQRQLNDNNCNSLTSCLNQLALNSRLIKDPITYLVDQSNRLEQLLRNSQQLQPVQQQQPVTRGKSPVVFVPGDGGSQMEARLNKTTRVHYFCSQSSDWYSIWLNLRLLAPLVIDCFYDNFRLHYNPSTGMTENTPGVEIRARNFGQLDPVAYLHPLHMPKTDYFETMIDQLERSYGLVRDVDMVGASFDFRKAPNELAHWLTNLTQLIERQYADSKQKPVTLICHSMGCLNAVYLLNQKPMAWKETYVKRLVALAAPWGGSFKAMSAMLFGDTLGIPLLDARKLRVLQASWPSLMYLFPRNVAFAPNQTLVQTPDFNYTLDSLDGLFAEANLTDQLEIWRQTSELANSLQAPQVELWCLAGSQVPTPASLSVSVPLAEAMDTFTYVELMGDGDGTVNIESSNVCLEWAKQQPKDKPVFMHKFPGIDHISMARDQRPAQFISDTIMARDQQVQPDPYSMMID